RREGLAPAPPAAGAPRTRAARPRPATPAPTTTARDGSLVLLQHLAEVLVQRLQLQALLIGQLGDHLGLLVLETPRYIDDADVKANKEIIELINHLGEHR